MIFDRDLITLNLPPPPVLLSDELRSAPAPDDDFWYSATTGGTYGVDQLIRLAAVGACIRVISQTIASLPLKVYQRLPDDGRIPAVDHPVYRLLHDAPEENRTAFEFLESGVRHILTRGAMLAEIGTDARNAITEIELVDEPFSIYKDKQLGIRVFRYSQDGEMKTLLDGQALCITGPGCTPYEISSLVEQHAESLGLGVTAQQYVRNYFSKGAIGPVFATFPQTMPEKAMKDWSEWFAKNFGGAQGTRRVPVMQGGGTLQALRIDHQQMQLEEMRARATQDAACVFGVPSHLIQDLARSTNNNIEHQGIEFVVHCIRPWCKRIESRLNLSLFGPIEGQRYYAEFDLDGLLRGDSEAQAKLMAAEIQNGVRTPQEWRRIRNLNRYETPVDGSPADWLYIQGATVPLHMAGQQQQQKAEVPK